MIQFAPEWLQAALYVVIDEANEVHVSALSEDSADDEHQQNPGSDSSDEVDHISNIQVGFK